ncbi:MAG: XRE family transcriptional regulator, partial [Alcaligenaceae bacterium]
MWRLCYMTSPWPGAVFLRSPSDMKVRTRPSPLPTATRLQIPEAWYLPKGSDAQETEPRSEFSLVLGKRIRALRVGRGMSGGQFAARCEVSRSFLSRVERGLTSISFESLARITKVLEIPLHRLLTFEEASGRCSFVQAGKGLVVTECMGAVAHLCEQLVGQLSASHAEMKSRILTVSAGGATLLYPQQNTLQTIYVIDGHARYRYGERSANISTGDVLVTDSASSLCIEAGPDAPLA